MLHQPSLLGRRARAPLVSFSGSFCTWNDAEPTEPQARVTMVILSLHLVSLDGEEPQYCQESCHGRSRDQLVPRPHTDKPSLPILPSSRIGGFPAFSCPVGTSLGTQLTVREGAPQRGLWPLGCGHSPPGQPALSAAQYFPLPGKREEKSTIMKRSKN